MCRDNSVCHAVNSYPVIAESHIKVFPFADYISSRVRYDIQAKFKRIYAGGEPEIPADTLLSHWSSMKFVQFCFCHFAGVWSLEGKGINF